MHKVRNAALTREFIDLAASEGDFNVYRNRAMEAHRKRFGSSCHPNVCYYPEFYLGE